MTTVRIVPTCWYVLSVKPGKEQSVRAEINRRIRIQQLEEHVQDFLIPKIYLPGIKKGQRTLTARNRYPGYLFIKMQYEDKVIHQIFKCRDVFTFLPYFDPELMTAEDTEAAMAQQNVNTGARPLSPKEVQYLLTLQQEQKGKDTGTTVMQLSYLVGDIVRITAGPFENTEGKILQIGTGAEPTITVEVSILGTKTPITLPYYQVEEV